MATITIITIFTIQQYYQKLLSKYPITIREKQDFGERFIIWNISENSTEGISILDYLRKINECFSQHFAFYCLLMKINCFSGHTESITEIITTEHKIEYIEEKSTTLLLEIFKDITT